MSGFQEPNSVDNLVQSESENSFEDSSNSLNFAKTWPDKQQETIQTLKDVQIDVKKHQIEQHEAEMQADIADHETSIQTEIREITAEITQLRVEVGALENELSDVQEQLKNDIINITKESSTKYNKYQSILLNDEPIIEQLKSAIEAQRKNHERNIDLIELGKKETMATIDNQIKVLSDEVELMRKKIIRAGQISSKNIGDTESSISLINLELESIDKKIQKLNEMKKKDTHTLSALKRELILNEEMSLSLHSQIDKAMETRTKVRFILNRSQLALWKSQTDFL